MASGDTPLNLGSSILIVAVTFEIGINANDKANDDDDDTKNHDNR